MSYHIWVGVADAKNVGFADLASERAIRSRPIADGQVCCREGWLWVETRNSPLPPRAHNAR